MDNRFGFTVDESKTVNVGEYGYCHYGKGNILLKVSDFQHFIHPIIGLSQSQIKEHYSEQILTKSAVTGNSYDNDFDNYYKETELKQQITELKKFASEALSIINYTPSSLAHGNFISENAELIEKYKL